MAGRGLESLCADAQSVSRSRRCRILQAFDQFGVRLKGGPEVQAAEVFCRHGWHANVLLQSAAVGTDDAELPSRHARPAVQIFRVVRPDKLPRIWPVRSVYDVGCKRGKGHDDAIAPRDDLEHGHLVRGQHETRVDAAL